MNQRCLYYRCTIHNHIAAFASQVQESRRLVANLQPGRYSHRAHHWQWRHPDALRGGGPRGHGRVPRADGGARRAHQALDLSGGQGGAEGGGQLLPVVSLISGQAAAQMLASGQKFRRRCTRCSDVSYNGTKCCGRLGGKTSTPQHLVLFATRNAPGHWWLFNQNVDVLNAPLNIRRAVSYC